MILFSMIRLTDETTFRLRYITANTFLLDSAATAFGLSPVIAMTVDAPDPGCR